MKDSLLAYMKEKYVIWKNLGETPFEALTRLGSDLEIPKSVPLTYAGRLDPAAEGLLIILTGEECKKKEEYTKLSKTYLTEILVGVSTDSFDLLGIPEMGLGVIPASEPESMKNKNGSRIKSGMTMQKVQEYLEEHTDTFTQKYPLYSSKTVNGTQMHEHARAGTDVELPEHEVTLHSFEDLSLEDVSSEDVLVRVGEIAGAVTGDFRQKEIVEAWANLELPEKLQLVELTITVGSGFYVRQLAEDLGKILGTGACLYSLVRTQIGDYHQAEY